MTARSTPWPHKQPWVGKWPYLGILYEGRCMDESEKGMDRVNVTECVYKNKVGAKYVGISFYGDR